MHNEMKYLSLSKVYTFLSSLFLLFNPRRNFNIFSVRKELNSLIKENKYLLRNGMESLKFVSNKIKIVIFINCPFEL